MAIKELELKVPTSYADISLKKWLDLQNDIKNYEGDEEAVTALMMYHLCGLPAEYLNKLGLENYIEIKNELSKFLSNIDLPLQRFIWIDGVEYGFEPNLSKMTYGAYADITKYQTIEIDTNWANIMSILYRPVTKKQGDMYLIKSYEGGIDSSKFLSVGMDVHFATLFFLLNLLTELWNDILSSSMEMDIPHNIKLILERSGQLTQQYMNSLKGTFSILTK